ncbi:MAG TPA: GLPGLI family protein [Chitinophagaceae bacterium]|nr:GLPGLI family protein [Chitinophagaceae bacterium]
MKRNIFLIISLVFVNHLSAQFIKAGKIEFERRTNQHSFLEDENMFDAMIKESMPKFAVTYNDLIFDERSSLFKEGKDPEHNKIHWSINYISNTVYRDFEKGSRTTRKNMFGTDYLVQDSLLKIDWKITNEPRTIAGFECKKAVGRIFDSVVVIAFYTDEILASAGPESFGGLPGMILGLAIPRLHTTWYATKLELIETPAIAPPKEGKKYNGDQFKKEVTELIKSNEWLKKIVWQTLI